MWITNMTGDEIVCLIDEKKYVIHQKEMLDVSEFRRIRVCQKGGSYSTDGVGNSKLLKFLKVTDDPFNFSKEYHIIIDLEVTKSQIGVYSGKTGHPSRRDGMLFRFKLYADSYV